MRDENPETMQESVQRTSTETETAPPLDPDGDESPNLSGGGDTAQALPDDGDGSCRKRMQRLRRWGSMKKTSSLVRIISSLSQRSIVAYALRANTNMLLSVSPPRRVEGTFYYARYEIYRVSRGSLISCVLPFHLLCCPLVDGHKSEQSEQSEQSAKSNICSEDFWLVDPLSVSRAGTRGRMYETTM